LSLFCTVHCCCCLLLGDRQSILCTVSATSLWL
jgi:hypothetical protein